MPPLAPVKQPQRLVLPVSHLVPVIREDPALPTDRSLRAVADDVIALVKYATAVAATERGTPPGALDAMVRGFLASRKPAARKRAAVHAQQLLAASEAQRMFELGRYSRISVDDYVALGSDDVGSRLAGLTVKPEQLRAGLDTFRLHHLKLPATLSPKAIDADLSAGLAFTKLRMFIRGVRCVEETDEIGSDEINLGAVKTTPSGDVSIIDQFEVSDDFDEGEKVTYPGIGRKLTGWNIVTSEPWPHVYAIALAMAEKDDGGFYKFLKELWDYVDDKVNALIAAGIGAAIGAEVGGILGAVVGAVVGAIIGWLINLFDNEDDIVGTKVLTMTLASARKSYYDWAKLTTADGWKGLLHYNGDGGHYRVSYGFKVFTE